MNSSTTYLILVGIGLISKVFGFFRETALAALFGSTAETDAYFVAITIPMILPALIGALLTTSFIPMMQRIEAERGKDAWNDFANNIFNITTAFLLITGLLGALCNEQIVHWMSPGFSPQNAALATQLSYITMPVLIFSGLITFTIGVYHSQHSFIIPAVFLLTLNVMILTSLFLAARYGIIWLAAGYTLGIALQCIFQWSLLGRVGYRWRWIFRLNDPDFLKMLRLCGPIAVASTVTQINMWVDRMLGSGLSPGGISGLYYGERLNTTLHSILVLTMATMLFPAMSRQIAEGREDKFRDMFRKGCSFILFISLPMTAFCSYYSEDIIRLVFMRGAFDVQAVAMTTGALLFLTLGLPALGIVELTNRAFYSLQDTKSPLLISTIAIGSNVLLSLLLITPLQQKGLALAASLATSFQAVGLIVLLHKKKAGLFTRQWLISLGFLSGIAFVGIALVHMLQFPQWWQGLLAYGVFYSIGAWQLSCVRELGIKVRLQHLVEQFAIDRGSKK
ncbi:MAG: murein biosynthesis integral rane protein MurJ [Firmicutes bacterium]|nr:murein biosynthesis integral rane protein MurJ [Bacillota bacterium]